MMSRLDIFTLIIIIWFHKVEDANGYGLKNRRQLIDRRRMIGRCSIVFGGLSLDKSSAQAVDTPEAVSSTCTDETSPPISRNRPYAPTESLVPALRVKNTIERSLQLVSATTDSSDTLSQLHDLWLIPQNFTKGYRIPDVPNQPAKQYLKRYEDNIKEVPLLAKPGAFFVGNGEIDAWKRLKRQERAREAQDEVRAALNIYTSNLAFNAGSYLLNVPKEERSRMIREDRLPDIKQVIASDMGMRYLYRNELLTAVDDVRAEIRLQEQRGRINEGDLTELLNEANSAIDKWFSLVDDCDVYKAQKVIIRYS